MIRELVELKTQKNIEMVSITHAVRSFVKKHNIQNGRIHIFVPHTTAGVTINENADPDVQCDLNMAIKKIFPDSLNIRHGEGNSAAHMMSSVIGVNLDIFIEEGKLLLGTWQGIYFWEFDGPRVRNYYIICE